MKLTKTCSKFASLFKELFQFTFQLRTKVSLCFWFLGRNNWRTSRWSSGWYLVNLHYLNVLLFKIGMGKGRGRSIIFFWIQKTLVSLRVYRNSALHHNAYHILVDFWYKFSLLSGSVGYYSEFNICRKWPFISNTPYCVVDFKGGPFTIK